MEILERVGQKVMSAREQRVRELLGDHVADEALAAEVAAEHGLPAERLYEVALWGAMRVQEFLDPAHEQTPKFYSCRTCWDTGYQVVEEKPGKSDSRACMACEKGVLILAADWLSVLRPIGRQGKRYDSHAGRDHFEKCFRHLPTLKEKLMAAMEYLEKREGGRA